MPKGSLAVSGIVRLYLLYSSYKALIEKHLRSTVLDDLPLNVQSLDETSADANMSSPLWCTRSFRAPHFFTSAVPEPNTNQYVFCRALADIGTIVTDEEYASIYVVLVLLLTFSLGVELFLIWEPALLLCYHIDVFSPTSCRATWSWCETNLVINMYIIWYREYY